MSEKPRRRRVYWLGCILAVLLVACGGATYLLWGMVQGIAGLFVTPPNPTNEPEVVHSFPGPLPTALAFSPDGRLLAAVSPPQWGQAADYRTDPPTDPALLTVYNVTTGVKAFSAPLSGWPKAVVFAPDGKHLAVGLGGLAAKAKGDEKAELVVFTVPGFAEAYRGRPGPEFVADRLLFAPDSTLLFAFQTSGVCAGQSVTAWRFPALTAGPKLVVAMERPECATVTLDGTIVIGGRTKDYTAAAERFDRAGRPLGPLKYVASPPGVVVRLVPSGKTVTEVSAAGSQDFDPTTGEPVGTSRIHNQQLYVATHASPDGTRVGSVHPRCRGGDGAGLPPVVHEGRVPARHQLEYREGPQLADRVLAAADAGGVLAGRPARRRRVRRHHRREGHRGEGVGVAVAGRMVRFRERRADHAPHAADARRFAEVPRDRRRHDAR